MNRSVISFFLFYFFPYSPIFINTGQWVIFLCWPMTDRSVWKSPWKNIRWSTSILKRYRGFRDALLIFSMNIKYIYYSKLLLQNVQAYFKPKLRSIYCFHKFQKTYILICVVLVNQIDSSFLNFIRYSLWFLFM